MPNYIDGIAQGGGGGGLTTVADVTASGGAVTEVGATVAFVDGGVYEFTATIIQNGVGTSRLGWVFDSSTTGADYPKYGSVYSRQSPDHNIQGSQYDDTFLYTAGQTKTAGEFVTCSARVSVKETRITCQVSVLKVDESSSTPVRFVASTFIYDNGAALPTEIGIISDLASGIANGSTFKGVRLY